MPARLLETHAVRDVAAPFVGSTSWLWVGLPSCGVPLTVLFYPRSGWSCKRCDRSYAAWMRRNP